MNLSNISPSHRQQFSANFSNMSPFHGQESSPNCCHVSHSFMGAVLQGQAGLLWAPLSMDLPWDHSLLPGTHLLWHRLLHGLQVDFCIPTSVPCRGTAASQWHHHGLWRNPNSGAWSTSFITDLGVCRVVLLTYSHPTFVWQQLHLCNKFFLHHLLKYDITEELSPFLIV